MSIPGVESARRRRASHGRCSSSGGSLLRPALRLTKLVTAATSSSGRVDASSDQQLQECGDGLHGQAMAARRRLDGKLRAQQVSSTAGASTSSMSSSRRSIGSPSPSHPPTPVLPLSSNENQRHSSGHGLQLREESLPPKLVDGPQEDCPVCLDSFSSGQMVIYLPCRHRFHSDCLVPWLQDHCHCPFCRAKIA